MVDFGLGDIGGSFMSWASSSIFWIFACFLLAGGALGALWIRRRRKMNRPVIEMYKKGNGKFSFTMTKGGWFRSHLTFKGLIDYGSEMVFRLNDNTPVYEVGHEDYVYINNKEGLIVMRDYMDPKFAFPVSKFDLDKEAKMAIASIASADLREAAVKAIEDTDAEMKTKWQEYAPMIAIGVIALVLVASVWIISTNNTKSVEATRLMLKESTDNAKAVYADAATICKNSNPAPNTRGIPAP